MTCATTHVQRVKYVGGVDIESLNFDDKKAAG
jgi:hypothetical protein